MILAPRLLSLDVDREAHPVIGGRPYVEGAVGPAVRETT
jgi:hypothetical protein